MAFIQLDGIGLSFADRQILINIHLAISSGSRIALAGANGSGKSTLMKIVAGKQEYDEGKIISSGGSRSAYLPQSGIVHKGKNLHEEMMEAFNELAILKNEADGITMLLEQKEGATNSLLGRYQEILDTLEHAGWERRAARIDYVLKGLGFNHADLERDVSTFSGGWQMRIALSKILLTSPDILLLDEPTNYLDLEAREWLRDFLKQFQGGVLLVSHDRSFLDDTCNQVAELLMARINIFKGTYSEYEILRKKDMADLMERWRRQQEEIAKIETFIARFRYQATKARQVQSRVKMLEKIEPIEIPPALKRMHFSFPEAPKSGKMVLRGEKIGRRYGDEVVFSALDLEIPRGSRTAVIGINGAGKTTLLRIISGEDPDFSGKCTLGSDVKIGYFSQDQESALDPSKTVFEEADKGADLGEGQLRSLLGAFLFSGDDIYKKVSVLSGGERNRLALLKILLDPVNLLILDEPTNHLDIHSRDILLEALQSFGGTLVIVSHDRYFLEKIADRILELKEGRGKIFLGDYRYYTRIKNKQTDSETVSTQSVHPKEARHTDNKEKQEEHKKRRSMINRIRRNEESLSLQLKKKEHQATEIRFALNQPDNYSNPDTAHALSTELIQIETCIEQLDTAWEEAFVALENAEKI